MNILGEADVYIDAYEYTNLLTLDTLLKLIVIVWTRKD